MPKKRRNSKKISKNKKKQKSFFRIKAALILIVALYFVLTTWRSTTVIQGAIKFFYPQHYANISLDSATISIWSGIDIQKLKLKIPIDKEIVTVKLKNVHIDISYSNLLLLDLKIGELHASECDVRVPPKITLPFELSALPFAGLQLLNEFDPVLPSHINIKKFKAQYQSKVQTIQNIAIAIDNSDKEYEVAFTDLRSSILPNIDRLDFDLYIKDYEWRLTELDFRTAKGGTVNGSVAFDILKKEMITLNVDIRKISLQWVELMMLKSPQSISGMLSGHLVKTKNKKLIKENSLVIDNLKLRNWYFQRNPPIADISKMVRNLRFDRVIMTPIEIGQNSLSWSQMVGEGKDLDINSKGIINYDGNFEIDIRGKISKQKIRSFSYGVRLALNDERPGEFKTKLKGTIEKQELIIDTELYSRAAVNQFKKIGSALGSIFD